MHDIISIFSAFYPHPFHFCFLSFRLILSPTLLCFGSLFLLFSIYIYIYIKKTSIKEISFHHSVTSPFSLCVSLPVCLLHLPDLFHRPLGPQALWTCALQSATPLLLCDSRAPHHLITLPFCF